MTDITILGKFRFRKINSIIPLSEFTDLISLGFLFPHDGVITNVLIQEHKTNITIDGWFCNIDFEPELLHKITIEELSKLPFDFYIEWKNNKVKIAS